jgi:hypothetical protein
MLMWGKPLLLSPRARVHSSASHTRLSARNRLAARVLSLARHAVPRQMGGRRRGGGSGGGGGRTYSFDGALAPRVEDYLRDQEGADADDIVEYLRCGSRRPRAAALSLLLR